MPSQQQGLLDIGTEELPEKRPHSREIIQNSPSASLGLEIVCGGGHPNYTEIFSQGCYV
jgi:hypothetical protein